MVTAAGLRVDFGGGFSLRFGALGAGPWSYPSGRIQKGLVLCREDRELVEEGTGFAVPMLRFGYETVFPGEARAVVEASGNGGAMVIRLDYTLNLVERMAANGRAIGGRMFYVAKEYLAGLHRRYPALRGLGTGAASGLRSVCRLDTRFETAASRGEVSVTCTIERRGRAGAAVLHISSDLSRVRREGCTGIVIANEQGAGCFDRYRDPCRALAGRAIGTWDETQAEWVAFIDSRDGVAFALHAVEGARMFRGWERVEGRLSWSGLSYVLPADRASFAYDIEIGTPDDLRSADIPLF